MTSEPWCDPQHEAGGFSSCGWSLPFWVSRRGARIVGGAIRSMRRRGRVETVEDVNTFVALVEPRPSGDHCEMCGTVDPRAEVFNVNFGRRCRRCFLHYSACEDCGRPVRTDPCGPDRPVTCADCLRTYAGAP